MATCMPEWFQTVAALEGGGVFGRVYEVRDQRVATGVPVRRAVRVLELNGDPDWLPPLRDRLEKLARLPLPHVSTPLESGICEDRFLYLVSDWYDKRLWDILPAQQGIPHDQAIHHFQQLLEGLAALHQHNLVHGDVRSHNVYLAGGQVWLADTIIGPMTWWSKGEHRDNQAKRYYAPERRGNRSDPSKPADVFGAAMVACEMLLGQRSNSTRRLASDEPVWNLLGPQLRAAGTPRSLAALLQEMLASDPEQRPADAGHALRRWTQLKAKQHRLPLMIAALVAAAGFLLAGLLGWRTAAVSEQLYATQDERDAAQQEQERLQGELSGAEAELRIKQQGLQQAGLEKVALQGQVDALRNEVEELSGATPPSPPSTATDSAEGIQAYWRKLVTRHERLPSLQVVERMKAQLSDSPPPAPIRADYVKYCRGLEQTARLLPFFDEWLEHDELLQRRFRSYVEAPWSELARKLAIDRLKDLEAAKDVWLELATGDLAWGQLLPRIVTDPDVSDGAQKVLEDWYGRVARQSESGWTMQLRSCQLQQDSYGLDRQIRVWSERGGAQDTYRHTWKVGNQHQYGNSVEDQRAIKWQPGQSLVLVLERYYALGNWPDLISVRFQGPLAIWHAHYLGRAQSQYGVLKFDIKEIEDQQIGPPRAVFPRKVSLP